MSKLAARASKFSPSWQSRANQSAVARGRQNATGATSNPVIVNLPKPVAPPVPMSKMGQLQRAARAMAALHSWGTLTSPTGGGSSTYYPNIQFLAPPTMSSTNASSTIPNTFTVTSNTMVNAYLQQLTSKIQRNGTVTFDLETEVGPQFVRMEERLWEGHKYTLPDGSVLTIDQDGNYEIIKSEKVRYRRHWNRDFNRYVNGSDLLEEFIEYLGTQGVTSKQFRKMPTEVFLAWIIVRAAEMDREPHEKEEQALLEGIDDVTLPVCHYCGRDLKGPAKELDMKFCNGDHMDKFMGKRDFTVPHEPDFIVSAARGRQRRLGVL